VRGRVQAAAEGETGHGGTMAEVATRDPVARVATQAATNRITAHRVFVVASEVVEATFYEGGGGGSAAKGLEQASEGGP
jgi:hypothetical protein